MPNLVEVTYQRTGQSTRLNEMGMRQMQANAYAARQAQYILLKAPPASGKSRALMFIALDKLYNQGIKKAIIAVPERQIGKSFSACPLTQFGFFADWNPQARFDLCIEGMEFSKVKAFENFMISQDRILICTHATLRFAFDALDVSVFNNCLLAVDEFHHVSADQQNNRLGELVHTVMTQTNAHIVAMTGSYFRGDGVAVLMPEDEAKFQRVTYNYYDQLNGYEYLQSLGIGYHFYQGRYLNAIDEILDTDKKTIIHIPNVNSSESTKEKYDEVDSILDKIGTIEKIDDFTCLYYVKRKTDGKILKVANLVDDDTRRREKIVSYLRTVKKPDDLDLIIALGMAKEGFDWPYCESMLTVGYRSSLTEIVQIIGRCTRDCPGKNHAQFTNLIAQPDATQETVTIAVNNMLKAITCSLLMEQVITPKYEFHTRLEGDKDPNKAGEVRIRGFKEPSTPRVKQIIESDLDDLKAKIFQDDQILKALPGTTDPETINKVLIPKVIQTIYPELTTQEIEEVRQAVVVDSVLKHATFKGTNNEFITISSRMFNIEDLSVDLIDRINPFQRAFEILSKSLDKRVFRLIMDTLESTRVEMTEQEAITLWPQIQEYCKKYGKAPDYQSPDPIVKRMGEAVIWLQAQKRKATAQGEAITIHNRIK